MSTVLRMASWALPPFYSGVFGGIRLLIKRMIDRLDGSTLFTIKRKRSRKLLFRVQFPLHSHGVDWRGLRPGAHLRALTCAAASTRCCPQTARVGLSPFGRPYGRGGRCLQPGRREQRCRPHGARTAPRGDAGLVHGVRHVRDHEPRAARRARRPQAGAPPHPLRHALTRAAARRGAQEVRARGWRGHRQVPPARRFVGVRRAGAHGAGLLVALAPHRRSRQLRLE